MDGGGGAASPAEQKVGIGMCRCRRLSPCLSLWIACRGVVDWGAQESYPHLLHTFPGQFPSIFSFCRPRPWTLSDALFFFSAPFRALRRLSTLNRTA
jgi:hypothetical protein